MAAAVARAAAFLLGLLLLSPTTAADNAPIYAEVGQTVTLVASGFSQLQPNSSAVYSWKFEGDGSQLLVNISDNNSADHVFSSPGSWNVSVSRTVDDAIPAEYESFIVVAQTAVSGLVVNLPNLNGVEANSSFDIGANVTDGTDVAFAFYVDGTLQWTFPTSGSAGSYHGVYSFPSAGNYEVTVTASNAVSNQSITRVLSAQVQITGMCVTLENSILIFGDPLVASVQISSGTSVNIAATVDGVDVASPQIQWEGLSGTVVVGTTQYDTGLHTLVLTASNLLSTVQAGVYFATESSIQPASTPSTVNAQIYAAVGQNVRLQDVSGFSTLPQCSSAVYIWQFGDSQTPVQTPSNSVDYAFSSPGSWTVAVSRTVWPNTQAGYDSFTVVAQTAVSGLVFNLPQSDGVEVNSTFDIGASVTGGTDVVFTYYVDGALLSTFPTSGSAGSFQDSLTFLSTGDHEVTVTVSNAVSNQSITRTLSAQVQIVDIDVTLVNSVLKVGDSLNASVQLSSGTSVIIVATVDGVDVASPQIHWEGLSGTVIVDTTPYTPGLHTLVLNASNLLSSLHAAVSFTTESAVQNARINVSSLAAVVGANIAFTVSIDSGSNVDCLVSFGDGQQLPLLLGAESGRTSVVTHSYDNSGTYVVQLVASNNVSSEISIINVTIQYPVTNLDLTAPTIIKKSRNQPAPATFTTTLSEGAVVPTDAVKVFSLGTTNCTSQQLASTGVVCAPIRAVTPLNVTASGTDVDTWYYPDYGTFNATITISNLVSSASWSFGINVDTDIENLTVSANGLAYVLWNTQIAVTAAVSWGSRISYVWNFGDGSQAVTTSQSTVNHTYATVGINNITVTASNLVSSVTNFITITSQMAILNLTLTCPTAVTEIGSVTFVQAWVNEGTSISWLFDTMDNGVVYSVNDSGLIQGGHFQLMNHTYSAVGTYNLSVVAKNLVSEATAIITLPVRERISGLKLTPVPHILYNNSTTINITMATGSDVFFISLFDGRPTRSWNMSFITKFGQVFLAPVDYLTSGFHWLSILGENLLGVDRDNLTVIVDYGVANVTLQASSVYLPLTQPVTLTVTIANGSRVNLNMSYGDGNFNTTYLDHDVTAADKITWTHEYTSAGTYTLMALATNNVSSAMSALNVTVQNPVAGLNVTTNVLVTKIQDQPACIVFYTNFTQTSGGIAYLVPTAAAKTFSLNSTNCTIQQSQVSGTVCQPLIVTTPLNVSSTWLDSDVLCYPDYGTYNADVNISNFVSFATWYFTFNVDTRIENLTISANGLTAVPFNTTATLTANITWGSRVTYIWNFGDGSSTLTTAVGVTQHVFLSVGYYNVTVTASNLVSSQTSFVVLASQNVVSNLTIIANSTVTEIGSPTFVKAWVSDGTNISWAFNTNENGVVYIFNDSTLTQGGRYQPANYTYQAVGYYNMTVRASNLVSSSMTSIVLPVQERLTSLKLYAPAHVLYNSTALVNMSMTTGSHVNFTSLVDGQATRLWAMNWTTRSGQAVLEPIDYVATGSHWLSIAGQNLLGTASDNVSFIVDYGITNISLQTSSIYLLPLTQLLNITVMIVRGSRVNFNMSFGDGNSSASYVDKDMSVTDVMTWTHAYSNIGTYVVSLTAINNVSSAVSAVNVTVQNPVAGLTVTAIQLVITKIQDQPAVVTFYTNFTSSSNGSPGATRPLPTDAVKTFMLNSTNCTVQQLLAASTTCIPLIATAPLNASTSWLDKDILYYPDYGTYSAVVNISNFISFATWSFTFNIDTRIENLTLSANGIKAVPFNTTTTLTANVTWGSRMTYTWNFGDGSSPINTTVGAIQHVYATVGYFNATVIASNLVSSATSWVILTCQKVVSNLTLIANQTVTVLGTATLLKAWISEGTNISWTFDTAENGVVYTFNDSTLTQGGRFQWVNHTYSAVGYYNMTVTATNLVSSALANISLPVQERITALRLTIPPHVLYNTTAIINVTLATGSYVTFSSLFDGQATRLWAVNWTAKYGQVILERIDYVTTGSHWLSIFGQNLLGYATDNITIVVDYGIEDLIVNVNSAYLQPRVQALIVNVSINRGSRVNFNISYGDGSSFANYLDYDVTTADKITLTHVYNASGRYQLTTTAFNNVSTATSIINITIQNPVVGLTLVPATNPVTKIQNNPAMVTFYTNFTAAANGSTYLIPTDASKFFSFGATNCTYQQQQQTMGISCLPLTMTSRLNASISWLDTDIAYYPDYGTYNAFVNISNFVNSMSWNFTFNVDTSIENLTVSSNGITALSVNSSATFTASITWGSRVTYTWDFGDATAKVNTTVGQVAHTFTTVGYYTVIVVASNLVSSATASIDIISQKVVSNLTLTALQAVTELGTLTYVHAWVNEGTNISWLFSTMDNGIYYSYNDTILTQGGRYQVVNHTYSTIGYFNMTVRATNLISSALAAITLPVQMRISQLQFVPRDHIRFNDTATVNITMANGSYVTYSSLFDGLPTRLWSMNWTSRNGQVTLQPIDYVRTGYHWLTFSGVNLLGNASDNITLLVDYEIQNLSAQLSSLYVRPVTEPLIINSTVSQGSRVNLNVSYGDISSDAYYLDKDATVLDQVIFSHIFSSAGIYTTLIKGYNNVSSSSLSFNITVQNPVAGLSVTTSSIVVKTRDQPTPIVFYTSFSPNYNSTTVAYLVPTDAFKSFLLGTTNCTILQLQYIENHCQSLTMTTPLNVSDTWIDSDMAYYPDYGTYNISLNVSNFVSHALWNFTVDIDTTIENLTIVTKGVVIVTYNTTLTLWANVSWGSRITYTWNFGDGSSVINTTQTQVQHAFIAAGYFNVTVTASNLVSSVTTYVMITSQKRVSNLTLIPQQIVTEIGYVTYMTAWVSEGTNISWTFNTMDNNTIYTFNDSTFTQGGRFQWVNHTYSSVGWYTMSVKAVNLVSSETTNFTLPVQEQISGLLIMPPPHIMYNTTMTVNFTMAEGSHVSYSSTFDGLSTRLWSMNWITQTGYATLAPVDYICTGYHNLTISGENLLGSASDNFTVVVDYSIKDLTFKVNTTYLRPTTDVMLANATISLGSRVNLNVSFGDSGSDALYWDFDANTTNVANFVNVYPTAGHYTAIMRAFNNVSSTASSISITVQNPVFGLSVQTNSPVTKFRNQSALVIFTVTFDSNNGTFLVPSESFKKYSFGTTNCTWATLSSRPSGCQQSTLSNTLNVSSESANVDTWYYPDYGTFNASLNVSNFVSYEFWNITVEVDTLIENISVDAGGLLFVRWNTTVTLYARKSWGTRITYVWDFGDGHTLVTSNDTVQHVYMDSGVYNISVNCSNLVSNQSNYFILIVQKEILNFTVEALQIVTPLHNLSLFEASVDQGTNITWMFNTTDTDIVYFVNNSNYTNGQQSHTLGHTFSKIGWWIMRVTVWNLVSSYYADISLPVQEQIQGLTVHQPPHLQYGKNMTILMTMWNGSYVNFTSTFDNKTFFIWTMSWVNQTGYAFISTKNYNTTGYHHLDIYGVNLIGDAYSETTLIIDYAIQSLLLSANTTYVRPVLDPVLLNITLEFGSRISFLLNYDDNSSDAYYWDNDMLSPDVVPFVHTFETAGHYAVNLTAVNNVSQAVSLVHITVQNPVLGLGVEATTPVAQHRTNLTAVSFFINFTSSACDGCLVPSEIFKMYTFGTTNCSISQKAAGAIGCTNASHHASANLSESWDDYDVWFYADPGTYEVTLNVSNFVSFMYWNFTVDVDTIIEDFTVDAGGLTFALWNTWVKLYARKSWGSRVTYIWDFGDGYNVTTANSSVEHMYTDEGYYNITVTCYNLISSMTNSFYLTVQKEVRNFTVNALQIVTELHNVTYFQATVDQGTNLTWMFNTTDSGVVYMIDNMNYTFGEQSHVLSHTYSRVNWWIMKVTVWNLVCQESLYLSLPVQERIEGLTILQPLHLQYGKSMMIYMTMWNGSYVNFSSTFDNKTSHQWNMNWLSQSGYANITPSDYNQTGYHYLDIFGVNLLGSAYNETTLIIDYAIQLLLLSVNTTYLKTSVDPVELNITMDYGSRVNLYLAYDDNSRDYYYWDSDMLQGDVVQFVHAYEDPGHYVANVTAVNNVSQSSSALTIIVQNPVLGLSVMATSPIAQYRNDSAGIYFYISFNESDMGYRVPTEIFKKYTFGTLNCSLKQQAAVGMAGCSPAVHHTQANVTDLWDDIDVWYYTDFGTYNVTLNVSNFVSFMYWNFTVDVDTLIENLTVDANGTWYIPWYTDLTFYARTTWGSRITYVWDFGDGTPSVTTATPTNFVSHSFASGGRFNVSVVASNLVNFMSNYFIIIVNAPIQNFTARGLEVVTLLHNPTWFEAEVDQGTNITWIFDTAEPGNVYTIFTPQDGHQSMTLNHTYAAWGLYWMRVTVFNFVSNYSTLILLPVQELIVGFLIHQPLHLRYGDTIIINQTMINGTHVNCTSTLDGYPTRNWTMDWVNRIGHTELTLADYKTTGPHILNMSATNLLNTETSDIVLWVDYELTNVSFAPNTTYLRTTTDVCNFNVTMSLGSRINMSITYGDNDSVFSYWDNDFLSYNVAQFTHNYELAGHYVATLLARNAINQEILSVNLTIQNPVFGMSVSTNSPRPIYPGQVSTVTFWLSFDSNGGEYLVATDAYEKYTYGNMACPESTTTSAATVRTASSATTNATTRAATSMTANTSAEINATVGTTTTTSLATTTTAQATTVAVTIPFVRTPTAPRNYTGCTSAVFVDYVVVSENLSDVNQWSYLDYGTYNVTLNVSNFVSFMFWSFTIDIDEPVLDLIIVPDRVWVEWNTTVNVSVTMSWGSRLNITWDWADGHDNETAVYIRYGLNSRVHRYDVIGVFYSAAHTKNLIGEVTAYVAAPIIVQYKVQQFVVVGPKNSLVIEATWRADVTFTLNVFKPYNIATNASYTIDFGDGTPVTSPGYLPGQRNPNLDTAGYSHALTFSHGYLFGGDYSVCVTLWNLINNGTYCFNHTIYEAIYQLRDNVFWMANGSATDGYAGVTNQKNFFPLGQELLFEANYTRGFRVYYDWDFGDGSPKEKYYLTSSVYHNYTQEGLYYVTLNASDLLDWELFVSIVIIQRRVENLAIWSDSPVALYTGLDFLTNLGSVGTDACYRYDFFDDSGSTGRYSYFGNKTVCEQVYPGENIWPLQEYDQDYLDSLSNGTTPSNVTVTNSFGAIGVYMVTLTGTNRVSQATASFRTGVTRKACRWPGVNLQSFNPCLDILACINGTKSFKKSERVNVYSSVNINCSSTTLAQYEWTIERSDSGNPLGPFVQVNIPGLSLISSNLKTLSVPPLYFAIGLYRFTLNVSMVGEINIATVDSVLIYVVRTPLVAGIAGGIKVRTPWNKNYTFDVASYSYDPDDPNNRTGFSFTWLCRRLCQGFQTYDAEYTRVIDPHYTNNCTRTVALSEAEAAAAGRSYEVVPTSDGCFVDNPPYTTPGVFTRSTSGIVVMDMGQAQEGDSIQVRVIVRLDGTMFIVDQYMDVIQGDPPLLSLECVSNCKAKVNYDGRFSLSTVTQGSPYSPYIWMWDLMYVPTGGNVLAVVEIPKTAWLSCASTGTERRTLAIEGYCFSEDTANRGLQYYMRLRAYRATSDASNYGEAYFAFELNKPPAIHASNCSISPANGSAILTTFNILCEAPPMSTVEFGPLMYQIGHFNLSSRTVTTWLYSGFDPTTSVQLPEGYADSDYLGSIIIKVTDSIGGTRMLNLDVTVTPPDVTDVKSTCQAIVGQSAAMVNLIMSGELTAVSAVYGAVASGINNMVSAPDTFNASGNSTLMELHEAEVLLDTEEYQKCIEVMLNQLEKLPPDSVDSVQLMMNVMARLLKLPKLVTLDALTTATNLVDTCMIAFNVYIPETEPSAEQLLQAATSLVGGAGAVLTATSAQLSVVTNTNVSITWIQEVANSIITALQVKIQELQVAGEPAAVMTTEALTATCHKEYPDSVGKAHKDAQLGNSFLTPTVDDLFGSSGNESGVLSIQTKTTTVRVNTLASANSSDTAGNSSAMSINSHVVSISIANETGQSGDFSNMTKPTHLTIAREKGSLSVTPVYGNATRVGAKKTTYYQTNIPKNSAIFITVQGIAQPLEVNLTNETSLGTTSRSLYTTPPTAVPTTSRQSSTPSMAVSVSTDSATSSSSLNVSSAVDASTPYPTATGGSNGPNSTTAATTTTSTATTTGTQPVSLSSATATTGAPTMTKEIAAAQGFQFMIYIGLDRRPTARRFDYMCLLPLQLGEVPYGNTTMTVPIAGGCAKANCPADGSVHTQNGSCEVPFQQQADLYPASGSSSIDVNTCQLSELWTNKSTDFIMYASVTYIGDQTSSTDASTAAANNGSGIAQALSDSTEFKMETFAAQCNYWSHYLDSWTSDGCKVGPLTQMNLTHCICYHLTPPKPINYTEPDSTSSSSGRKRRSTSSSTASGISFGAGVVVPMNSINLADSAFNHLDDNPLVFTVMISIICLYACALIWAKKKDQLDQVKAGASPLLDNDPNDKYLYELTLYTGSRKGAGTTAKVSMIIAGEMEETTPRLIFDDVRPVLKKSGVDSFIMAVPRPLGNLAHIRVWHDNSGKSPGWFFSRMLVVDMQTLQKFYFILDRWLAVDEDDGVIDRIVPLAGKEEMTGFSHLFWTKTKKGLFDGHLWFSIVGRPHKSRFTRCQRLTTALSLLFTSMIFNILFYKTDSTETPSTSFTIGPITITAQQLLKGLFASLIATPVNFVILFIFTKAKPRPYKKKEKKTAEERARDELRAHLAFLDGGTPTEGARHDGKDVAETTTPTTEATKKKKKKGLSLPWWTIYIAYFLSVAIWAVAVWYVTEAAGVFGETKSSAWLISFVTSIVESIFISQPIKVIALAVFFAMFIKKPANDEDSDPGLEKGQEYLHKHYKAEDMRDPTIRRAMAKYRHVPLPPSEEYLLAARNMKVKENRMMDLLKEICFYIIFLFLIMMSSFGGHEAQGNFMFANMVEELNQAAYTQTDWQAPDMDHVTSFSPFFKWARSTLLPSLYGEPWYNGRSYSSSSMFGIDRNMILVGVPRLRQVRTVPAKCKMPVYKIKEVCIGTYNLLTEDTGLYHTGWKPINTTIESNGDSWWSYKNSTTTGSYITVGTLSAYSGGGFVAELGNTMRTASWYLSQLQSNSWLDNKTAAVFVEFVMYNPNLDLFVVSLIFFEFTNVGAVLPKFNIQLLRLFKYTNMTLLAILGCQVLTFGFVIFFIVKEIRLMVKLKRRYLSFWNVMEVIMLTLCLATVGVFFSRLVELESVISKLQASTSNYISFQQAAALDSLFTSVVGLVTFLAFIKLLKLLRFNKRLLVLGMVFSRVTRPLVSFLGVAGILFMGYAMLTNTVYGTQLASFSDLTSTCQYLLTLVFNKFSYNDLMQANPIFTPVIFVSFIVIINFLMISFMMTLIMDGFTAVKEELAGKANKYEVVEYIVTKFKGMLGFGAGVTLPAMRKEADIIAQEREMKLFDKFDEMEDKFKDYYADETVGEEDEVRECERELMQEQSEARCRTVFTA